MGDHYPHQNFIQQSLNVKDSKIIAFLAELIFETIRAFGQPFEFDSEGIPKVKKEMENNKQEVS